MMAGPSAGGTRRGRWIRATCLGVIAGILTLLEVAGWFGPLGGAYREWVGASAMRGNPEPVTAVEIDTATGPGIAALDAALLLRAVAPFEPRVVVFLDPIEGGTSVELLASKLRGLKFAVVFTASAGVPNLPNVTGEPAAATEVEGADLGAVVAGAQAEVRSIVAEASEAVVPTAALRVLMLGESVRAAGVRGKLPGLLRVGVRRIFVDREGAVAIDDEASAFVERLNFGDLMVDNTRRERGVISPAMDARLRGRVVACGLVSAGPDRAETLAAVLNGQTDRGTPWWLVALPVVVAGSTVFWPGDRGDRVIASLIVTAVGLLLALGISAEFGVVVPMAAMLVLPIFAAGRRRAVRSST